MKLTFKDIEEKGLLLYKYIRGSQAYGTNTPESDQDEGGVFIAPQDWVDGLGFDYSEEISDEKHDTVWWELGKFMRLLCTSNPTVLEALFIPEDKVLYEHPIMTELKKNRDMFVTKACFKPFGGYATSQIAKAQGQNKKIHWDINEMTRKTPLDFCYTFHKQGSQNIQDWLSERGLNQKYCGLVNIPNMKDMYGVYYDWAAHWKFENTNKHMLHAYAFENISYSEIERIKDRYKNKAFFGYSGIVHPDGTSNELRLSSIPKGEKQICFLSYNQDGYTSHCRKYKEYLEWKENRNKARYENNLEGLEKDKEKFYDSKNMMHCFRLLSMCIEVAEGKGILVDRTNIDRDFLMDVRNRKYTYDELMGKLLDLKARMDKAIENTNIRDSIDVALSILAFKSRSFPISSS